MLLEDYISLLESPDSVTADDIPDLQALVRYAPYCQSANLLLLNALHKAHDTNYEAFLPKAVCYASTPREAWQLLHPKEIIRKAPVAQGDYFSFVTQLETLAEQTGTTFLELAKRFQTSRQQITHGQSSSNSLPAHEVETSFMASLSEQTNGEQRTAHGDSNDTILAKLQAQYAENLRNPKKSIYFADQMRFLEKAIELRKAQNNTNKSTNTNN